MKIRLNLASEPSGGQRAFWTLVSLVGGALLLAAVALVWSWASSSSIPEELVARETQLKAELVQLSQREAQASSKLRDPLGVEIIDRSAFLNQLLIRKGTSWTRTFLDLEQVLPPDVRATMIRPEVAFDQTLQLDMTVAAKTPDDFIEFLKSVEASQLFGHPTVRGSAPPTESNPTFRYQVTVSYEQQL